MSQPQEPQSPPAPRPRRRSSFIGKLLPFKRTKSPPPPLPPTTTSTTKSKPKSALKPDTASLKSTATTSTSSTNPTTRTYTPRHSGRDAMLSIPLKDRPGALAHARETHLRRTNSTTSVNSKVLFAQASHSFGSIAERMLSEDGSGRLDREAFIKGYTAGVIDEQNGRTLDAGSVRNFSKPFSAVRVGVEREYWGRRSMPDLRVAAGSLRASPSMPDVAGNASGSGRSGRDSPPPPVPQLPVAFQKGRVGEPPARTSSKRASSVPPIKATAQKSRSPRDSKDSMLKATLLSSAASVVESESSYSMKGIQDYSGETSYRGSSVTSMEEAGDFTDATEACVSDDEKDSDVDSFDTACEDGSEADSVYEMTGSCPGAW